MRRIAVVALLIGSGVVGAQAPGGMSVPTAPATWTTVPFPSGDPIVPGRALDGPGEGRRPFESDHCFGNFIGPISNPILAKDPRSLTEVRGLFIHNAFPDSNPVLRGGTAQAYGLQARLALTERLTLIADKDGYASLSPGGLPHQNGWLDIAAGLKYTFIRDVENQFLASAGFMYEIPTGEDKVFQGRGPGLWTVFGNVGKELGFWHVLVNGGYQFGNRNYNSSLFYAQLHLDRQFFGWLYPLAEVNWYRYTASGRALPEALGEGDGIYNFGTNGSAGQHIVTTALGAKAQLSRHADIGVAWEFPLSGRRDQIISQRILAELILRY